MYVWKEEVTTDSELLLMIKTRAQLVDEITIYVKANHPFDECEVISVPVEGGSKSYIDWVLSSTGN